MIKLTLRIGINFWQTLTMIWADYTEAKDDESTIKLYDIRQ